MAKGGKFPCASTSSAPVVCDSAMWSPCSDCSSEENNSPTALNSFIWDKPALEDKAVEFGLPPADRSGQTSPELNGARKRPVSNGYVNLKSSFGERGSDKNLMRCLPDKSDDFRSDGDSNDSRGTPILSGSASESNPDPSSHGFEGTRRSVSPTITARESYLMSPPSPVESKESLIAKLRKEQESLKKVPWFQAGIPREIALEVLSEKPVGSFIVRDSTTKPGCYALSLRVPPGKNPTGIAHYLILQTTRGYKIKGFTKEFSTLDALITHHSVMPELLPCPLDLPRPHKGGQPHKRREDDMDFVDNDDQSDKRSLFSDIHWLMNDLEL